MGDGKVMNEAILKIDDLRKKYDDGSEYVLKGINVELEKEDFLCVLGGSGCGKSTLLRCIAGFEKYEGSIIANGKTVTKPGSDRIVVFQDFNQLLPWKTVLHNVTYPLKKNGISDKKERDAKARKYLEKVGLLEYENFYPHQLSGGMKQRVAIAKGLALGTDIMLMDEPFASLDAISRNQMQKELLKIKEREKITVVFITHNIQEAVSLSNKIIVLGKNGKIQEFIENKLEKPVTPATEGYGKMWDHLNNILVESTN